MQLIRWALPLFLLTSSALANYSGHPRVPELYDRLRTQYGFSEADLQRVQAALATAEQVPKLIESEQQAKERTLTWDSYRKIHLTAANFENGARFLAEQRPWLARAEAQYGVPPTVIAAILGVETKYGSYTGKNRILDALATQGFDHPTRSVFFFGELVEFFVLCRERGFEPGDLKGSYAGAMGAAQFMPSNYRRLAVDFDGDGRSDLWQLPDAIGSIASYLSAYDAARAWQRGQPLAVPAHLARGTHASWPINAKTQTHRVGDFLRVGVSPGIGLPIGTPVGLLELKLAAAVADAPPVPEYWLGLSNFYSVMSYNPRVYYAMAVSQLADALQNPPESK